MRGGEILEVLKPWVVAGVDADLPSGGDGGHRPASKVAGHQMLAWVVEECAQNAKHSDRSPIIDRPSRGGAGGPTDRPAAAWLFGPPGVEASKRWLTDAKVGRPNVPSMNLRIDANSYKVGSR